MQKNMLGLFIFKERLEYMNMRTSRFSLVLLSALFFTISTTAADNTPSIYDIIKNEDQETFSDMVMLGYDIDERDADGFTPLMIASSLGKTDFAAFLINNGADVNARSKSGLTALHRAAQAGSTAIIQLLTEADAFIDLPDNDGMTPLMVAVMANKFFAVDLLIKRGAVLSFRNAEGRTALWLSDRKRFTEISKYLRLKGAKY